MNEEEFNPIQEILEELNRRAEKFGKIEDKADNVLERAAQRYRIKLTETVDDPTSEFTERDFMVSIYAYRKICDAIGEAIHNMPKIQNVRMLLEALIDTQRSMLALQNELFAAQPK